MTMPTWDPPVRLDYVFVPRAFRERMVACEGVRDGDAATASDHFPVVADFVITQTGKFAIAFTHRSW